ncbi:MAG: 2-hydroxychromene-2-carboxylate isomerase [Hyphomicrobiales bacterium]|nr:2-hydroxychromene-2-carboxylate isomerase [Hyphomicrobiales bacterium]
MAVEVSYFFSMISPFAYIGHDPFMALAAKYDLAVHYRPMMLGEVFAETGGLPLGKRHPLRQAYRLIELQRWREKRGLKFKLKPDHWPFDCGLADRVVIAICEAGQNPGPFMALGFHAIWVEDRNLADDSVVADVLEAAQMKSGPLIKAAKEDRTGELYRQYTDEAIERGCFGSPCYVLNDEPFWGQDRVDLLEDAIRSGRQPYTVPAA